MINTREQAAARSATWRATRKAATRIRREALIRETRRAIVDADGDPAVASSTLGVRPSELRRRAEVAGMHAWIKTAWETRPDRWREVVGIAYEGKGKARMRIYSVRCGVEIHVKRVPAVGVERKRVVCTACMEARTT